MEATQLTHLRQFGCKGAEAILSAAHAEHTQDRIKLQDIPLLVLADLLTLQKLLPEKNLSSLQVSLLGDVTQETEAYFSAWIEAALCFGFTLALAFPQNAEPQGNLAESIDFALDGRAKIFLTYDKAMALNQADAAFMLPWGPEPASALALAASRVPFVFFCGKAEEQLAQNPTSWYASNAEREESRAAVAHAFQAFIQTL